jgi:hypothetical protein
VIGDKDPEDAWDDGDPFPARLLLLAHIVAAIMFDADPARAVRRRADVARLLYKLAAEYG